LSVLWTCCDVDMFKNEIQNIVNAKLKLYWFCKEFGIVLEQQSQTIADADCAAI